MKSQQVQREAESAFLTKKEERLREEDDRLKKVDKNSNSCNIREGSSHRQVKKT